MLTGPELGAAIEAARILKKVTKKAMAEHFHVAPPSVQDWVKRGTIEKQKLPQLWAYFSDVVGPSHWGLADWNYPQHSLAGLASYPVAQSMSVSGSQTPLPAAIQVPVIGTLRMGATGMLELRTTPEGSPLGFVRAFTLNANSYALQIFGDELYPAVRHGACLVVEPGSPCTAGELMMLETKDGYYMICELVAAHEDAVTWAPATGGGRRTISMTEIASMQPVVDVIPASRLKMDAS